MQISVREFSVILKAHHQFESSASISKGQPVKEEHLLLLRWIEDRHTLLSIGESMKPEVADGMGWIITLDKYDSSE